ncbi:MAG: SMP-30/gluconolactonase/LRE family protein [Deltaproteobacteria bacterium]|nr:SMP-30/gluconolactonase/LRE family protein [Deltaproteobacteria bacterium]
MFKKTITIALVLLIIIVIWFVNLLWSAGQFKTIEPHFEGACTQIPGLSGAEDITIHPKTGIAYISACDRRAVNAGKAGNGAIYAYNLNAPDPVLFNLTSNMGRDFQPHGISLYVDNNGKGFLFAINHARGVHTIEVYELIGIALYHTKTISDPMLVSPNDLVAVGPDSFYVSNDHGHVSGIMRVMEDYLKLPLSNVVYYDGSRFSEAASGIKYANGINVSSDGKTLYLCAVTELSLRLYDREVSSGKLSLREKIKLDTGVDNIEIDSSGGLWIGAHPRLLDFVAHAKDPSRLSPSQILYLSPKPSGGFNIKEVYLNKGDELSAASVAAVRGRRMLIGSVFDPKILDCQMK